MRILQIFRIYFYSHGSPSCIICQHIITILFLFSGSYQTDFNTTLRALSDVTYTNFTSLTADLHFYKSNGWNREVLKMMTLTTLKVLIWFFRIPQSRTSEDTNTISYVIKKIEEIGVCSFKLLKDPLLYRYMFTLLSTSDVDIIDGSIDLQIIHQLDESNRDIDLPAYHAIRQRLIAIIPSPYLTFLNVIQFIAPDLTSFVELLMSNETRFLEYLIGFLRFLDSEDGWGELKKACGKQFAEGIVDVEVEDQVTEVICLLEELNEKIQSLHVSGLWPYDPTPLVRRLVNVLDRVVNKDQAVSYD
ncbi:hypothetical protein BKA69DRAFT_210486 [Paraphysoderma sedebokerense]|nr:hypothetical protein BKA69DRAFT_210486 [Paraphysoderma sedebokerense]